MDLTETELWDGRRVWSWGLVDGLPAWRWGWAPSGVATRRQLHEQGLQLARRQEPAGVLIWKSRFGQRTANLYREDQAVRLQEFTPRRRASLTLAYLAQHVCRCGREHDYYARVLGCAQCAPVAVE